MPVLLLAWPSEHDVANGEACLPSIGLSLVAGRSKQGL